MDLIKHKAAKFAIIVLATFLIVPSLTIVAPASTASASPSDIKINEIMYDPSTGSQWVEIYNKGSTSQSIAGWVLSNDTLRVKYRFPTDMPAVPPKNYVVVHFAAGIDESIFGMFGLTQANALHLYQEVWSEHQIRGSGGGWFSSVADINKDGYNDVIVDDYWYKGHANPYSDWTDRYFIGTVGTDHHVYDIDGDGDLDIVAGSSTNKLVWYQAPSNPQGAWTSHTIDNNASVSTYPHFCDGIDVADIDNDNNPDVITEGPVWYEAPDDPTGTWIKHQVATTGPKYSSGYGPKVADMDNDGHPDIITLGTSLHWYGSPDNPADNDSWPVHEIHSFKAAVYDFALVDVDGDNDMDVVAGAHMKNWGPIIEWFENPSWKPHGIDGTQAYTPYEIVAEDMDLDGDKDFVVVGHKVGTESTRDVLWYETPANPATTIYWPHYATGKRVIGGNLGSGGLWGISVGDIDNDALPDVVVSNIYSTSKIEWFGDLLDHIDELALFSGGAQVTKLVDFVAWGADPGDQDCVGVVAGKWDAGDYVDTTGFVRNNTLGRDQNCTDTDQPADWEITCGKHSARATPGYRNKAAPTEIPVANAGPDQTALVGQQLTLDGSGSSDPDGAIVEYKWEYRPRYYLTGRSVDHVYHSPGTYTVTLTVTDDDGLMATDTCQITVKEREVDLTVSDITFSKADPRAGEAITVSAKIHNEGNRDIPPTDILAASWYVDDELATGDYPAKPSPGETAKTSFDWVAEEGKHAIKVVVDQSDSITESKEDNNQTETLITVVGRLRELCAPAGITTDPAVPVEGEDLTIYITIENTGSLSSGDFDINFMLDNSIHGGDIPVANIGSDGSVTKSYTIRGTWIRKGQHTIEVRIDKNGDVEESNEENNTVTKPITVVTKSPDLTVSASDITFSPVVIATGQEAIKISAVIHNMGKAKVQDLAVSQDIYQVHFYVNGEYTDAYNFQNIEAGKTLVAAGHIIQPKAGAYEVKIKIDPQNKIAELSKANNETTVTFDFLSDLAIDPKQINTAQAVLMGQGDPQSSVMIALRARVVNRGQAPIEAYNIPVMFYYLEPRVLFEFDLMTGKIEQVTHHERVAFFSTSLTGDGSFAPGDSRSASTWLPTELLKGKHDIYFEVDPDNIIKEEKEDNNRVCLTYEYEAPPGINMDINILPPVLNQPDLSLSPLDIEYLEAYSAIAVTVHNTGEADAADFAVLVYADGELIQKEISSGIKAGMTMTTQIPYDVPGEHLIRVVVDGAGQIAESSEDNNEAFKGITVAPPAKPDLTISPNDITYLEPPYVEQPTIQAIIHNIGNAAAGEFVVAFYVDDEPEVKIMLPRGEEVGVEEMSTMRISIKPVPKIHAIRVVIDPDNEIDEWREDNNEATKEVTILPPPGTPTLYDPGISVASGEPYVLEWTGVSEAAGYTLQEDTDISFTSPVSMHFSETVTWYSCSGHSPLSTTTYYYRVRAENDYGSSEWSNVVDMEVIAVPIIIPPIPLPRH